MKAILTQNSNCHGFPNIMFDPALPSFMMVSFHILSCARLLVSISNHNILAALTVLSLRVGSFLGHLLLKTLIFSPTNRFQAIVKRMVSSDCTQTVFPDRHRKEPVGSAARLERRVMT